MFAWYIYDQALRRKRFQAIIIAHGSRFEHIMISLVTSGDESGLYLVLSMNEMDQDSIRIDGMPPSDMCS